MSNPVISPSVPINLFFVFMDISRDKIEVEKFRDPRGLPIQSVNRIIPLNKISSHKTGVQCNMCFERFREEELISGLGTCPVCMKQLDEEEKEPQKFEIAPQQMIRKCKSHLADLCDPNVVKPVLPNPPRLVRETTSGYSASVSNCPKTALPNLEEDDEYYH